LIATGFKADINVIDYDNLKLHLPTVTHSLPAQGRRIVQPASGYIATIVDGEITYRHGMATGARPGRLTRLAPCCSRQTDAA
jgi:N-acyl-D-aspartate/D-glutamate deacylase